MAYDTTTDDAVVAVGSLAICAGLVLTAALFALGVWIAHQ